MTPLKAAYAMAHESKLGIAALAALVRKSTTTLCHELAPPAGSSAKLGLETTIHLTEATNDDRVLLAWAESRGYRCVRVSRAVELAHCDLLHAAARFASEAGEALASLRTIECGRATENEIVHFEREVADIAPAAIALAERMRQLAAHQARARAVSPASRGTPLPLKKSTTVSATL